MHDCPRCGRPVPDSTGRRGRPRLWCSDNCRRRGSERDIRVQEVVRERVVERRIQVPHSARSAVDLVLTDLDAVKLLLQRLTDRASAAPRTELEWVRLRRVGFLAYQADRLAAACHTAKTVPRPDDVSAATPAPEPVPAVLPPTKPRPGQRPAGSKRRRRR